MIVQGARSIASLIWVLAILATASTTFADKGDELDRPKVIGVVPLTRAGMTQNVYRNIDRLIPYLKKIPSERIVKLECRFNGLPEREQDVLSAYLIAGRVEKYLREHHKINLDLWIAAQVGTQTAKSPPALTFSVFPDAVRNIEKLPVNPVN